YLFIICSCFFSSALLSSFFPYTTLFCSLGIPRSACMRSFPTRRSSDRLASRGRQAGAVGRSARDRPGVSSAVQRPVALLLAPRREAKSRRRNSLNLAIASALVHFGRTNV